MNLESRSFSTEYFRPTPVILLDQEKQYLIVATSWSLREHAEFVINEMKDYIQTSMSDVEVTSPYEFIPSLTREANILRISILIANLKLAKHYNSTEYAAGVEVTVIHKNSHFLSWATVGSNEIYLLRNKQVVSLESSASTEDVPIPKNMLGLESSVYPKCNQMNIKNNDLIVILSRSFGLSGLSIGESVNLDSIAKQLVLANPNSPFWLGVLE